MNVRPGPLLSVLFLFFCCLARATPPTAVDDGAAPSSRQAARSLAPWQGELLDLALDAASAMPLHPHVKNRSRAQAVVLDAWLELDQPERALATAERIANWRRGMGYADIAWRCATRGETGEAVTALDLARAFLELPVDENDQEWRRERVVARVAQAEAALLAGAPPEKPVPLEAAAVDAQMAQLEALAPKAEFSQLIAALDDGVATWARVQGDAALRDRVEASLARAWAKMPVDRILDLQLRMADAALAAGDSARSLQLVAAARTRVVDAPFRPEQRVPLLARMAAARHRAGERDAARAELDAAFAAYREAHDKIVDLWRAGALRPVAEAYHALGDDGSALGVYKLATADGATNPNARPRCDDLVATCCSMALQGVPPDPELRARLARIRAELADPW